MALLDRLAVWNGNPITEAAQLYLAKVILDTTYQSWKALLWCAYVMKDHGLTAPIAKLPIYGPAPKAGKHGWLKFSVMVNGMRLQGFTKTILKKREQMKQRQEKKNAKSNP